MGVKDINILSRMMEAIGAEKEGDLATDIGKSAQSLSNAKSAPGGIPDGIIIAFWQKHPDISLDWVLTGYGPQRRVQFDKFSDSGLVGEPLVPFGDLPPVNQRIIKLISLFDLTDDGFCRRLDLRMDEFLKIKAGGNVSGILMRAICYELGVRMRWLSQGEEPIYTEK